MCEILFDYLVCGYRGRWGGGPGGPAHPFWYESVNSWGLDPPSFIGIVINYKDK